MTKKASTKRAPRRKAPARRRFVKPSRITPNSAKCVETFNVGFLEANVAHDFSIQGIVPQIAGVPTRAAIMAPAFGLYRIASVVWKITPKYDTYTPNLVPIGDAPVEVPNLYYKLNRYGDAPVGFTYEDLQSLGAKPIRLDDKTLTIKYRPNILLANVGGNAVAQGGGSGQVKMTPWLSTDTQADNDAFALSTTEHYGHMMFIECAAAGDGTPVICELSCQVVYEFKSPRIMQGVGAQEHRLSTKHVVHTLAKSEVKQEATFKPDGWNLRNSPSY